MLKVLLDTMHGLRILLEVRLERILSLKSQLLECNGKLEKQQLAPKNQSSATLINLTAIKQNQCLSFLVFQIILGIKQEAKTSQSQDMALILEQLMLKLTVKFVKSLHSQDMSFLAQYKQLPQLLICPKSILDNTECLENLSKVPLIG